MGPKGNANRRYEVHGDGVASLPGAFDSIAMPAHRRAIAAELVEDVLRANDATDFRWYRTARTEEIACYWDDHHTNVLWITSGEVHILNDDARVTKPDRPTDWTKEDGRYVGWLLPGADRGVGGGRRQPQAKQVLCPNQFLEYPAGSQCPYCELDH